MIVAVPVMINLMKITLLLSLTAIMLLLLIWLTAPTASEYSVRPLAELSTVRQIAPDEWIGIVTSGENSEAGTVLLPRRASGPGFESGILPASRGFLTPDVCGKCHQENYTGFLLTSHARTSMEPRTDTIPGSFEPGRNTLKTRDPHLWFTMTKDQAGFYQELTVEKDLVRYEYRRSIDLVIGSGNHGQGYLSWEGDHLYQMHVSYLKEMDQWVNSPGLYIDGTADFARPVPGRCLDCHATWFAEDVKSINRFDRSNYVLGVTCVRCHGPGHEHTAYHLEFPDADVGKQIVNPARLSRERINELCAQCHSSGEPLAPAFAYRPGEPLSAYLELDLSADDSGNEDPHSANQLARLMKSECYRQTETLTCITCHNPHRNQRGDTAGYSKGCHQCHAPESCTERSVTGSAIDDRCVECHMPSRRDAQVRIEMASGTVTALIRDHLIGNWPEASDHIRKKISAASREKSGAVPGRVSSPEVLE